MTFSLTTEQEAIQASARAVFKDKSRTRDCFDGGSSLDRDLWDALIAVGVSGLGLGELGGGLEAGLIEMALVAEESGRVVAAVPFLTTTVMSGTLLTEVASPPAMELAQSIGSGDKIVATAVSGRSDAPSALTADRTHGGQWTLTGEIPFIVGAELADQLIVPAPVDDVPALYLVDAAAEGVVVTELPTLDPTRRAASVAMDGAAALRLDEGVDIAELADRVVMRAEVILAAEALGAASAALERSAEYALNRSQFGRPIGQFQAVKHTLADMLVDVENARSATYNAAWAFDELGSGAGLDVAMAKGLATENAVSVINRAIQIHGGLGVTWEDDLHILLRRAKSCSLLLGDPGEQFERIAAALLDGDGIADGSP
ncbi:acyl-CoA dehydrogenase family protein [Candidatus Poriferisocius sp.]|uniref:acyl-CoA dehydrogenase family protein n=1 Tax=Candidatus Poriferisocius sp. TaxID=3101276 RepID=UPI003B0227B6